MSDDASLYHVLEQYPDEAAAERYFEQRRWPNGARCTSCGSGNVFRGAQPKRKRQVWHCRQCRKQFSVTSGTIMEATKMPLRKWLLAFHFMGASKKGMSALQLSRMLHLRVATAWHLCHRIRATMKDDSQLFTGIVETDETYIGGRRKGYGRGYRANKEAVQAIVRRNRPGRKDSRAQTIALSHEPVDGRTVGAKLRKHTIPSRTVLMTDDSPIYTRLGQRYKDHHVVNHKAKQYAYDAPDGHLATTNTAEGLFSNLKRQINGTHHHTSKKHLPKYLEEYDYKYNTRQKTDGERTTGAVQNIEGKRLTLYKPKSGHGESLFDGKVGERRRKPKRAVKKRKRTKPAKVARPVKASTTTTPAKPKPKAPTRRKRS